jgi:hypothetical protein
VGNEINLDSLPPDVRQRLAADLEQHSEEDKLQVCILLVQTYSDFYLNGKILTIEEQDAFIAKIMLPEKFPLAWSDVAPLLAQACNCLRLQATGSTN